jgi:hypothetical protein
VKAGDTLLSVATGPGSVVADAELLKNANLDILYGTDYKLYLGQHLRLPTHHCFEDEVNECYSVTSIDTLQSVAKAYKMTAATLCKANGAIFGRNYCDPAVEPLPKLLVGMELTVLRLYPIPPSPCQEIPGYWICYTVNVNDTIWDIAPVLKVEVYDLVEVNYGKHAAQCSNCSNATECPVSKGPYPECLTIGEVLAVRVNKCTPKPGAWGCFTPDEPEIDGFNLSATGPYEQGLTFSLADDLGSIGSPIDLSFFCKANRHSIAACRMGASSLQNNSTLHTLQRPNRGVTERRERITPTDGWIKAPYFRCVPNDKSYCSNDASAAGDWGNPALSTHTHGPLTTWDGNALPLAGLNDWYCCPKAEYHIPRGSLPPDPDGGCYSDGPFEIAHCTPTPGKHMCHKPLAPTYGVWADTVDQIAEQFGLDPKELCKLSGLKNCSTFCQYSAFKIPVVSPTKLSLSASSSAHPH